jgi:hypothetical protein
MQGKARQSKTTKRFGVVLVSCRLALVSFRCALHVVGCVFPRFASASLSVFALVSLWLRFASVWPPRVGFGPARFAYVIVSLRLVVALLWFCFSFALWLVLLSRWFRFASSWLCFVLLRLASVGFGFALVLVGIALVSLRFASLRPWLV